MDEKSKTASHNVVRFRSEDRKKRSDSSKIVPDSWDQGPSPEESLRVMRAFVAIKNRTLRANLTAMLEQASRVRGHIPAKE